MLGNLESGGRGEGMEGLAMGVLGGLAWTGEEESDGRKGTGM